MKEDNMKWLAYIICYCIYPFSFFFKRNENKWAFGSFRGAFNDNTKYLFIYACKHNHGQHIKWLSISRKTVKQIRSLNLPAEWVFSPKGIWFALTSMYWFVNSYTSDILFCLSGNATVINLWHGVGLKRCEFNITSGSLSKRYIDRDFKEVFTHPECFRRPNYLVSSTDFQSQMFAKAFRLDISQCLNLGYPRNQILLQPKAVVRSFLNHYEPQETVALLDEIQTFDKVYIYMPTWRDSQKEVFLEYFDLEQLETVLAKQNALLLLKPHANTIVNNIPQSEHIRFVPGRVDVYGILPFTDVLITDYSSILYDYILMDGKDVILYLYDYEDYVKERDFYYPFDENVCGKRAYDFETLLSLLKTKNYELEKAARQYIVEKFWGESMKTDVCGNIIKTFTTPSRTRMPKMVT